MPVGDPVFVNAALGQSLSSVASNGRDYLVLWSDERGLPSGGNGGLSALWAGRLDATGHPVEPAGHKVVDAAVGKLVWTGTSYALVYSTGGISFLQMLDDNGYPTAPPVHLDLGGPPFAVGTNGNTILTTDFTGEVFLVDFNGGVLRQHIGHQLVVVSPIGATPGGDYFFAAMETDCSNCAPRIVLEQVDRATAVVTRHPLLDVNLGTRMNAAASDDGRMLVAWSDPVADANAVRYEIVDSTAHVLAGPSLLPSGAFSYDISVGFDGRDFLVASASQSWRIASNGQVLDRGTADAGALLFAHGASSVLEAHTAVTNGDVDTLVRAAPSFAELRAAPERSVAMSSRRQQEPRLASSAAGFTAWIENATSLMVQPAGGAATHIAEVPGYFSSALAVAGGGNGYLIAWEGVVADNKLAYFARRLRLDGTPLDAAPISFAAGDVSGPISVAFDGSNYLAVWPAFNGAVHGVRIAANGTLLDATPLVLAPANNHAASSPRVVWNGKSFVVAWLDEIFCLCAISPAPPPEVRVLAMRVGRDGKPLDAAPALVWDKTSVLSSLALTTNGDGAALVWTGAGCVWAAALRDDETLAGDARSLTCLTLPSVYSNSFSDAGVAWSGSEYVAIWRDPGPNVIRAERLDRALATIDDFDVSPAGLAAAQPDIAAIATGVAIAYVRSAPEPEFGGAPRVFVRSLERLEPAPPRRRALH